MERMPAPSFALVAALIVLVGCVGLPSVASSATSGSVVGATVPSATSISAAGCPSLTAGVTHFGAVTPGSSVTTTADCEVQFGSSNDSAMLRLYQTDGGGDSMVAGATSTSLGYWPLNGDLRDVSATGNTGDPLPGGSNTPTFPAGLAGKGQALYSDGDAYATIPSHASYDVAAFTVDAWFRTTDTDGVIAARQDSSCGGGVTCQWELWIDNGGRLDANLEVGATEHFATWATSVNDGAWHHAAMTVDPTTFTISLYVDGILRGTDATWTTGASDLGTGSPIVIGRTAVNGNFYAGDVDELRFQAGVRSASDIQQYYAGRILDYGGAGALWGGAATSGMFGACLSSVVDGAATDGTTWTPNVGCPIADAAHWKAVVATGATAGAKIATSPVGDIDAKARMRFGFRASGSLAPGSYTAPITFETVAPAV